VQILLSQKADISKNEKGKSNGKFYTLMLDIFSALISCFAKLHLSQLKKLIR